MSEAAMRTLLIVYHSRTGGTRQMAEAARSGASECAIQVRLLEAQDAGPEDLLAADGYVFAAPENLAAMSGPMKDFFDRCYYPVLDHLGGRAYALLVCAGSDGSNAVRQMERIATGWRLRPACDPVIVCTHAQTAEAILAPKHIAPDELQRCATVGQTLAAGLELGIY